MKYGYIGLGHLGANLAMNVVKAGYEVTVTDLNKDNAKKLIAAGAKWADTPKGVAENSDAVITCLPSPKVSMAVLTGKDGILAGLKKGGTWIENSTNGKEEIEAMAKIAAEHGVETLEAPVTGGVHKAAQGTITILIGGEKAIFDKHADELAKAVLRLKAAADGQRMPVQVIEVNYQTMAGVCPWWDAAKQA